MINYCTCNKTLNQNEIEFLEKVTLFVQVERARGRSGIEPDRDTVPYAFVPQSDVS